MAQQQWGDISEDVVVQTHNPAESSKRTFQFFKTVLTAGSDQRATISSLQLAITSVTSSTPLSGVSIRLWPRSLGRFLDFFPSINRLQIPSYITLEVRHRFSKDLEDLIALLPPRRPVPQIFSSSRFLHAAEVQDEVEGVGIYRLATTHYR